MQKQKVLSIRAFHLYFTLVPMTWTVHFYGTKKSQVTDPEPAGSPHIHAVVAEKTGLTLGTIFAKKKRASQVISRKRYEKKASPGPKSSEPIDL
jgi:hypothetical protein